MSVRRSQGKARPQPARATELPRGVAAPAPEPTRPVARAADGRIASKEAARELGRRGGRARAERDAKQWGRTLGLGGLLASLEADPHVKPFADESARWYRDKVEEIARAVGGGVASAGVCSVLKTAAWQRAFSCFLFELAATRAFAWHRGAEGEKRTIDPRTDLALTASRLGDASRQNMLAAHELAAREALARPKAPTWYAAALPATTSTRTDSIESGDDLEDQAIEVEPEPAPSSRDDDPSALEDDDRGEQRSASRTTRVQPVVVPRPVPQWCPQRAAWVDPSEAAPRPASIVPRHVVEGMRARGEVVPSNWVIEGEEQSR